MAPTKSNHRRKSKTPKRVINDGKLDNQDESATFLPQDPKALANLLQTRPKREFYESPTMPDMFYESIKQQRKDSQSEETAYTCWACKKKTYSSVSGLHYHVMNSCPQISILKFKCLICQEEFKAQDAMLEHLQDVHVKPYISESSLPKSGRTAAHAGRLKIQMFAESSEAAESLSASPDKDTEDFSEDFVYYQQEDDKCDEDVLPTKNFRGKQKRVRPSGGGPSDTYAAMDKPLADAFEWTYQFKKKLEESYLKNHLHFHSDFAHWEEIDTADLAETFNLTKTSPLFAINSDILNTIRKGKKPVTLKDKNNMNYKRLELFEALTTEQGGPMTFFVGGPVWAMSWCPYPNKSEQAQYLAIATHVGEHPLQPDVTYKEQSVIQLWNCGKLPVKSITTKLQSPSLAYGIALSSGPVWCLEWCPLVHKEPDPTVECEKLGLLAAACGSGDVRIFVMPKPSKKGIIKAGCKVKRAQLTSIPGLGNIYRVNPTILLKPARKRSFGQCLCFAWSPHGDCSVIVAGFASGFIAFWDINASSKLLTDKIGDVLILYPFSTYRAHSKAVRDVVWCPFNSNILVSTGADRFLKIWDRRKLDADIPVSI
ncbi:unnamed protein product [Clavelina lepadiformis]|uniref:C2H2-type domain-containing protein n=1 Tax=Clavelina lepadiformis TaxID=159417 RepID=A0ABP0GEN5_CLALP